MLKYDHTLCWVLGENKPWFRYDFFDIDVYDLQVSSESPQQLLHELIHSKRFAFAYMGGDKEGSIDFQQHGPYILDQISVSSYEEITAPQAIEQLYEEEMKGFEYYRADEVEAFLGEGNTPPFSAIDERWIQNNLIPILESATTIFRLKRDTPFLEYLEGYVGAFTEWVAITDSHLSLIVLYND